MTSVGFIGLGAMGQPMVRQLLQKGFAVTVNDIVAANVEAVTSEGATAAGSAADVARKSDAVITMLPNTPDVEPVLFGEDGLCEGASDDLLYIDMSTISPTASKAFAGRLAARGITMVDAPVTGSTFKAATGELNIFTGASEEAFARALPILSAMGTPQHVGPQGSGALIKVIHNTILATTMVGVIEGFAMAARSGLDLEHLRQVLSKGTCTSFALETWTTQTILRDDFSKGFYTRLMVKDLGLSLDLARDLGMMAMGTAATREIYALAADQGYANIDYSSIFKLYTGESRP